MSVWISDVIKEAGYDYKNNVDDAKWLLAQENEFKWMCADAMECIEKARDNEN